MSTQGDFSNIDDLEYKTLESIKSLINDSLLLRALGTSGNKGFLSIIKKLIVIIEDHESRIAALEAV